jgi:cytochrome c-type biogenesis protein CcmH
VNSRSEVIRNTVRLIWLLVLLVMSAASAAAVTAQSDVTLDQVYAIARKLYCPVCPNETLDACRTTSCERWRAEIRSQLVNGRTEEQIVADFVARYGERVLGTPQDPLLRALSLYMPFLGAGAAAIIGLYTLVRWNARRQAAAAAQIPITPGLPADDPYRARLENDVKK